MKKLMAILAAMSMGGASFADNGGNLGDEVGSLMRSGTGKQLVLSMEYVGGLAVIVGSLVGQERALDRYRAAAEKLSQAKAVHEKHLAPHEARMAKLEEGIAKASRTLSKGEELSIKKFHEVLAKRVKWQVELQEFRLKMLSKAADPAPVLASAPREMQSALRQVRGYQALRYLTEGALILDAAGHLWALVDHSETPIFLGGIQKISGDATEAVIDYRRLKKRSQEIQASPRKGEAKGFRSPPTKSHQ